MAELLEDKDFEKFEEMVHENRHLINCLRDDDDQTLLMIAVLSNDDVFDYLIKKSQDFSIVSRGWKIIHYIVLSGDDDEKCESRLIKLSHKTNVESLINERDVNGQTSLHYAAIMNKHRTIAWLISMGSDVNVRDNYNKLPDEQDFCDDEKKE